MNSRRKTSIVAAGIAVLLGLSACGDATRTDGSSYDTKKDEIRVVPTFEVEGTHDFPENVRFDDLGLSVASIKLTPVEDRSRVAYSTSKPESVQFDVGEGKIQSQGRTLRLPEAGKFDVTLRLEPVSKQANEDKAEYSLAVSGYVAGFADAKSSSGTQDGRPIPMPATPDEFSDDDSDSTHASDRSTRPKAWLPFEYSTDESVHYTLDEVNFSEGTQFLTFTFDAEDWASEIAKPIERAVRSKTGSKSGTEYGGEAVDVTQAVDSRGEGSTSLGEHVSVNTRRSSGGGL